MNLQGRSFNTFELLGDYSSQPSRAVFALATINKDKVNFTITPVNISMLEQYKPEFKKVNPVAKVPGMREINPGESDFNMMESHAIMKYICQRQNLPQHWYPFNAQTP